MWLSAMGALEMNGRWVFWGEVCEEKRQEVVQVWVLKSVLRWLVQQLPQNARCFLHEFLLEKEWFIIVKRSLQ